MGVSLKNRLNGNKADFLKDIENFGQYPALTMWRDRLDGYTSLEGLAKFLVEEGKDENFGLNPRASAYQSKGLEGSLREVLVTAANIVVQVKMENELLRRELEAYRTNNNVVERKFAGECLDLVAAMNGKVGA